MPVPSKNNAHFDNVLQRLHRLSISTAASEPRSPLSPLGPAFSFSDVNSKAAAPTYEPRPAPALDLSPQSSASSDFSSVSSGRDSFDAFVRTQSRVVRVRAFVFLWHTFHAPNLRSRSPICHRCHTGFCLLCSHSMCVFYFFCVSTIESEFLAGPCSNAVDIACAGGKSLCLGGISNASRGKTPETFPIWSRAVRAT